MVIGSTWLQKIAEKIGAAKENIQPSSVDLSLGGEILELPSPIFSPDATRARFHAGAYDRWRVPASRSKVYESIPQEWKEFGVADKAYYYSIPDGEQFMFLPGMFYLASTKERIRVPQDMRAFGSLKSTTARLSINQLTALYVDPGFEGTLVLELYALLPTLVRIGDPIIQLEFAMVAGASKYKGRYQGQDGIVLARRDDGHG